MHRILINTPATLPIVVDVGGVATNPSPDSATVTITRDDGTVVVTNAAATDGGTGEFSYTLTVAQNDRLDILTATWTTALGVFTTTTEVAGGVLFTIAQARARKPLDNTTTYTTARIIEARTLVESRLEQLCGVAFVERYGKTTLSGNGRSSILLPPRVNVIRSVTLDGMSVDPSYVATMRLLPTGELYYPSFWGQGYANYEITYEHGYGDGPERAAASTAALIWAKGELVSGPVDDRMTSMSTEDGTFALTTAGMRGNPTSYPDVNAFIQQYNLNVAVA